MPKHGSINLYVHGSQKARWDGQLRTSTSTLTQLLNYDNGGGSSHTYMPSAGLPEEVIVGPHMPPSSVPGVCYKK